MSHLDESDPGAERELLLLRILEEYPALAPVLGDFADAFVAARISPDEVSAVISMHRKAPVLLALLVGILGIVSAQTADTHATSP